MSVLSGISLAIGVGITAMHASGVLGSVGLTHNGSQLTFNGVDLEYTQ